MSISRFISFICYSIIKSTLFEYLVLATILFNTVTLMMDDPTSNTSNPVTDGIEEFFLIAYTTEMCLKIIGLGLVLNKGCIYYKKNYFLSISSRWLEYFRLCHRSDFTSSSINGWELISEFIFTSKFKSFETIKNNKFYTSIKSIK